MLIILTTISEENLGSLKEIKTISVNKGIKTMVKTNLLNSFTIPPTVVTKARYNKDHKVC